MLFRISVSTVATKVTNSGMMAQGKNATLDDVRATEAAIKSAGSATAQDYGALAGGTAPPARMAAGRRSR